MDWTSDEIVLLKKNYTSTPVRALLTQLNNRTVQAIYNKAHKLGLCSEYSRKNSRQYNIDTDYFHSINLNNAYWAGFIAADGCIYDDGILSIELQGGDVHHLAKFCRAIQFTGPIQTRSRNNQKLIQISCAGFAFRDDLKQNFNIVPNKSLILLPPNLIHTVDISAFIRGNLEGDGSICFHKNMRHWSVQFNGTKSLLEWVKTQIKTYVADVGNPSACPDRNIFKLTFKGYQTETILNWLYNNSVSETRLDRKYNKYLELKGFYNRGKRNK